MSISWGCKPLPLPEKGWDAFSPLTNTQDLLAWASACAQLLLKARGLVPGAFHIWILDSKSTMWILLIPHWQRISELRVIICNGPNPKSPAEAAVTSEEVQNQIRLLWLTPAPQAVHVTLMQPQSRETKANHRLVDAPAVLDLLKLDSGLSLSQLAIPLAWLEAKDMICFSPAVC